MRDKIKIIKMTVKLNFPSVHSTSQLYQISEIEKMIVVKHIEDKTISFKEQFPGGQKPILK